MVFILFFGGKNIKIKLKKKLIIRFKISSKNDSSGYEYFHRKTLGTTSKKKKNNCFFLIFFGKKC